MNAPIDTLAFAERFETAGFAHDQARALANAFSKAQELGREDLVTKSYLDVKIAELRTEIVQTLAEQNRSLSQALADQNLSLSQALADQNLSLTKAIAENGKDISNRLWSTVTIIAGVSTAISATIGAGVALVLKWNGI